jgi:hypothetical protein
VDHHQASVVSPEVVLLQGSSLLDSGVEALHLQVSLPKDSQAASNLHQDSSHHSPVLVGEDRKVMKVRVEDDIHKEAVEGIEVSSVIDLEVMILAEFMMKVLPAALKGSKMASHTKKQFVAYANQCTTNDMIRQLYMLYL